MRRILALIALGGLAAACSPKAEAPAPKPIATTSPEPAPSASPTQSVTPFLGHWRQSAAVIAPWWKGPASEKPEADPEFASKDMVLTATSSYGPGIVNCEEAIYSPTTLPLDSLFEGGLTDPARQAAALGIRGTDIPTVLQGCKSSTGDLELLFHLIDPDTMMLGLNNMIYTLKRVPPPPGGWPPDAPQN